LKLSVVIPVYNENASIGELVRRVRAAPVDKEIILVDDCSTDGTRDTLQALASAGDLTILYHDRNRGKGAALRTGIAAARGIALAAGKPAVGLSTLAAFAAPFIAADDSLPVVAAIDARHDHVYLQVFGPGGRTVVSPRVTPLREALRVSTSGAPRIVGTAAGKLAAAWPASERAPSAVEQRAAPRIDWVARLGAAATDTDTPPKPLYLRAADAHPQDAVQLARR